MSNASIKIFADYFGINLNPTISNKSTGELLISKPLEVFVNKDINSKLDSSL